MRKLIAALTAVSILAGFAATGCGSGEPEAASAATELVPAGAVMYAEATLRPEGDQGEALDALLAKFPGGGQAFARLREEIEKSLRESDHGLSYSEDIEPWLGDEAAFFVGSMEGSGQVEDGAALIASEDDEQAEAALEKTAEGELQRKTYNDVEYMVDSANAAVVLGGFVAIGPEASIKQVIDTSEGGESLADDEAYNDAVEGATEDRLGLFYFNSPALAETLRGMGTALPGSYFDRFLEEPLVATIAVHDDGLVVEGAIPEEMAESSFLGQGSGLLEDLPADSWLALSQADLGEALDLYVETLSDALGGRDAVERQLRGVTGLDLDEDVLAWMGDFGVFARGSSVPELNGALIVETDDEDATGRFLDALERLARAQVEGGAQVGPLAAPGGGEGFTVRAPAVPQPIHLFQRGGRFVIAYGDAAASDAIDAGQKLGDAADFADARDSLGDYDVSTYVLLGPILELIDRSGAGANPEWEQAQPYLEPLSALVAGTKGEGDDMRSAMKIVVK